jgi:hypothetical protein
LHWLLDELFMIELSVVVTVLFIVAFLARWLAYTLQSSGSGADHWYWIAYIEAYKNQKHFPPNLPQYILEEAQWYPPVFPLLIAHLPNGFFQKWNYQIAVAIDLMRMTGLLIVLGELGDWDSLTVLVGGLIYATTPILVSYNIQLNPRGLGAFLLDALIFLVIWENFLAGPDWLWLLVFPISGLILLTHKMTTQFLWFLCLGASVIEGNFLYLALIPGSILAAFILSGGFYRKVLLAHWDIISFWNRNWPWLQSHPIKESPLYMENDYETPTKFHRKGIAGILRHLKYLIGFNPSAWIIFFGLCLTEMSTILSTHNEWIAVSGWLALSLLFSLATVFIPILKCLGGGHLYLYNSAFPATLLAGLAFKQQGSATHGIFFLALLINIIIIAVYYRSLKLKSNQVANTSVEKMLNRMKELPAGVVMCLPPQWYDMIAYKTKKQVLFGGHGLGFKLLEPTFPILRKPIEDIVREYNVSYLITQKGYLPENFMAQVSCKSEDQIEEYIIYHF